MNTTKFSHWRDELKKKPQAEPVILDGNTGKILSEKQINDEKIASLRAAWVSDFETIFREIFRHR